MWWWYAILVFSWPYFQVSCPQVSVREALLKFLFYISVSSHIHSVIEQVISPQWSATSVESQATLTMYRYTLEHTLHLRIAMITIICSYFYIKHYLKTHHSVETISAETVPSKNMFLIKSIIVGLQLQLLCWVVSVLVHQNLQQNIPVGVFVSSTFLVLIKFNFARTNVI